MDWFWMQCQQWICRLLVLRLNLFQRLTPTFLGKMNDSHIALHKKNVLNVKLATKLRAHSHVLDC